MTKSKVDNEQLIYGALCKLAARISHFFPSAKGSWHLEKQMINFTIGPSYWLQVTVSEPILAKSRGHKGVFLHLLNSAQQILAEHECSTKCPEKDEGITRWLNLARSRVLTETESTRKAANATEFHKSRPPERLSTMIDLLPPPGTAGTLTLFGGMAGSGKTNALMRLVYDWNKALREPANVFTMDIKAVAWIKRFNNRFGCVPFGSIVEGNQKAEEWLDGLSRGAYALAVVDGHCNASELATLKRVAMEKNLTIVCSYQVSRTGKNTWFKGKGMDVPDSLVSILPDGIFAIHKNRSGKAIVFRAPLPFPGGL